MMRQRHTVAVVFRLLWLGFCWLTFFQQDTIAAAVAPTPPGTTSWLAVAQHVAKLPAAAAASLPPLPPPLPPPQAPPSLIRHGSSPAILSVDGNKHTRKKKGHNSHGEAPAAIEPLPPHLSPLVRSASSPADQQHPTIPTVYPSPPPPHTRFSRQIEGLLSDKPELKGWADKVTALRTKYQNALHTKPHVLIVGAGPMGLNTAMLLVIEGNYRVTIVEKTNGLDSRWNGILADGALYEMFARELDLNLDANPPQTTWIGTLAEYQLVMGATLTHIGVEILYNTMYLQTCVDPRGEGHNQVHIAQTPTDETLRRKIYSEAELCAAAAGGPSLSPPLAGLQHHAVVQDVKILIGADGTHSAVRSTVLNTHACRPSVSPARVVLVPVQRMLPLVPSLPSFLLPIMHLEITLLLLLLWLQLLLPPVLLDSSLFMIHQSRYCSDNTRPLCCWVDTIIPHRLLPHPLQQ